MVRIALLLLVAGGCDLVIAIEEPAPTACGPYGSLTPVAFDPLIEAPYGFSVRANGMLGAVTARVAGVTHTYVIQLDDTGVWRLHSNPARNTGLGAVRDGSIGDRGATEVDELYGATGEPGATFTWIFATPTWGTDANPIKQDQLYDVTVGNVVEVVEEIDGVIVPQRKRAVVTLTPDDGVGKNLLLFTDLLAPYAGALWNDDPERTDPINRDPDESPSQGVLTDDLFTLVYAARRRGGSSDLYVSRRDDVTRQWRPGTRLRGVNTDADELEPWINRDCSTLYFFRDGVTYQAQRVDE
ncbi:MAG: hypothetical protein M3680_19285 [Myxococcota bacterium]|nr:hypothetical protein [Myxococcota bacterium]